MTIKSNTRVTIDIPTADHKKLKLLAAYHGKSMREIFISIIEQGLKEYDECSHNHTPNEITKKTIENIEKKKGLKSAESVEALFKKLSE